MKMRCRTPWNPLKTHFEGQKRALKIIKAEKKRYEELLGLFNVEKLQIRHDKLCEQYMDKIKNQNHQLC